MTFCIDSGGWFFGSILYSMSGLYEGCWHKLDRAKKHTDALKNDLRIWAADLDRIHPYTIRQEFDSDTDCISVTIDTVGRLPVEWSLIIGDALTNFRAALDYLAHDLVGRGSKPHKRGTRDPQFVISSNPEHFARRRKNDLPGVKTAHWTILEAYQPYYWLDVKVLHPFALLDELVRWDKHRELEPAVAQLGGDLAMRVVGARDFIPQRQALGRDVAPYPRPRLDPNTEVMRVFGRKTGPNPHVIVNFSSPLGVAFQNGLWVESTLDQIGATIAQLFAELEPIL